MKMNRLSLLFLLLIGSLIITQSQFITEPNNNFYLCGKGCLYNWHGLGNSVYPYPVQFWSCLNDCYDLLRRY